MFGKFLLYSKPEHHLFDSQFCSSIRELLESIGFEWAKKRSSNDISYQLDSGDECGPGPLPPPQAQASNKDSNHTEFDNASSHTSQNSLQHQTPAERRDQCSTERNVAEKDATSTCANDIVGSEDVPNQMGEEDGPPPPHSKSLREQASQTQTGLDCSSKSVTQHSTQQQAGASVITKQCCGNTNALKKAAKLAEGKPNVNDPRKVVGQKVNQCEKKEPGIPEHFMAEIFNKYAMAKFEHGDEPPIGFLATLLDDTKRELNMESVNFSLSKLAASLEHKWRKFCNK